MPLLSLVLAVHGEQAYIEECAESILGQDSADLELIAVDAAAPGHAPALLDELAARDPRVTVRHLPEQAGPGEARNAGLELASGDYVWFVNATDRVPPGALRGVLEELRTSSPDVLLVHHTLTDALRRSRPGPHRKALARAAKKGPGPLSEHRQLAHAAPEAFDKLFRRAFLAEAGSRFGPGRHSELSVTWPALLHAARIAALPAASYERRLPGNAAPEPGSPFDVFGQYDAVLRHAGERRDLVARAMLRHLLGLLEGVPQDRRREFFHGMSESYRAAGGGAAGGRAARLVAADSYAGFALLQRSIDARRALFRGRRAVRSRARRAARKARDRRLDRHYRAQLRRPIDPDLAVFAAYWYSAYSCNPRAIYEKARELVPGMRGVWVVKAGAVDSLPPGVDHVIARSREYYETIARARYFVNNVNFPNDLVKRDGTIHVMTHHGTPLKRMGLDQGQAPVSGARIDFAALMRRCARWDFSVASNAFSTLVWDHAYPVPFESIEVGYPRNDVLATATEDDVRRIRGELGIGPDQVAVLYAPTHREYHDGYVPTIDLAAVAEELGPEYVVLSRAHYFYDDSGLRDGQVRDVSSHQSVEELMLAANVLVTDYSSIMFDYGVLDRPIVIHAPDWEVYRTLRGTYFDLTREPPGPVTRSAAEVVEAIRAGDGAPEARAAFRARFCSLEDGHAAERVVRRVWFGERAPADRRVPAVVG